MTNTAPFKHKQAGASRGEGLGAPGEKTSGAPN